MLVKHKNQNSIFCGKSAQKQWCWFDRIFMHQVGVVCFFVFKHCVYHLFSLHGIVVFVWHVYSLHIVYLRVFRVSICKPQNAQKLKCQHSWYILSLSVTVFIAAYCNTMQYGECKHSTQVYITCSSVSAFSTRYVHVVFLQYIRVYVFVVAPLWVFSI